MKLLLVAATSIASLLVASPAFAIVNGGFDSGLSGWSVSTVGSFTGGTNLYPLNSFPIAGTYGRVYSHIGASFSPGQYGEVSQSVDLTGISTIRFDASLDSFDSVEMNNWNTNFLASFLVGGTQMWSANVAGDYLNVLIDVSGISGIVDIAFRNSAVSTASGLPSNWFAFDNVATSSSTVVPVPAALPLGAAALAGLGLLGRRKARAS